MGWCAPAGRSNGPGTMFVWAEIPEPYRSMGSLEFTFKLLDEAKVAVSPGIGFGPAGDGHVRFALVENEHRIGQAVRGSSGRSTRFPPEGEWRFDQSRTATVVG